MSKSCKPILVNNTPCNCVTAVTSAGLYGVASPLYPTTASLNALHTVQYNDRVVMYKRTATGWIEVQNYPYSGGGTDTDTSIRFVEALPTGEWSWEIRDVTVYNGKNVTVQLRFTTTINGTLHSVNIPAGGTYSNTLKRDAYTNEGTYVTAEIFTGFGAAGAYGQNTDFQWNETNLVRINNG